MQLYHFTRRSEGLEYTVEYTCTLYGGLCIVSCCVGEGGGGVGAEHLQL